MLGNFLHSHHFKRQITLWPLIFIGLGNTIEASIFVLLGEGVKIAGGLLPAAFLLGALIAICAAWIYAKIASINPTSGADIGFLFEIIPYKSLSFSISWLIILGDLSFIALNALGIGMYLQNILQMPALIISATILITVTFLNISGVKKTSAIDSWLTIFLLICLSSLIIFSLKTVSFPLWLSNIPSNINDFPWMIFAATAFIYSTYIGYEDIVSVSGEVAMPHKTIPRALISTVLITAVLYIGMSFILVSHLTNQQVTSNALPLVALAQSINFPVSIIYLAAIIAVATTLVTMLLVCSRKMYAMMSAISPKSSLLQLNSHEVPYKLILITCCISLIILFSSSVQLIAYVTNSVYLVGLLATTIGLYFYEKHKLHLITPTYQIPFYPWSIFLVIGFSIILIIMSDLWALLGIFGWLVVGLLVYYLRNIAKSAY